MSKVWLSIVRGDTGYVVEVNSDDISRGRLEYGASIIGEHLTRFAAEFTIRERLIREVWVTFHPMTEGD